jgi:hypothetical protein
MSESSTIPKIGTVCRIAFEDPQISAFIQRYFSVPEAGRKVFSQKWLQRENGRRIWRVEILEKQKSKGLISAALVDIDPRKGNVLKTVFLHDLLFDEYLDWVLDKEPY